MFTEAGESTHNYDFNVWLDDDLNNSWNQSSDFSFTVSTAPVPEPETYAMLLAGLGLLGFTARSQEKLHRVNGLSSIHNGGLGSRFSFWVY